jgi:hypothetical protein
MRSRTQVSNEGSEHVTAPAVCICGWAISQRPIDSGSALHGLTLTVCKHCGVAGWTWVLVHAPLQKLAA